MIDPKYYMEEGCGIFAVALSRLSPGGTIGIISNNDGESWDDDTPEITHVFYELNGKRFDAKGERNRDEMAADFDLFEIGEDYDLDTGHLPEAFFKQYMGGSGEFPLFGEEEDIQEAIEFIVANSALFRLYK